LIYAGYHKAEKLYESLRDEVVITLETLPPDITDTPQRPDISAPGGTETPAAPDPDPEVGLRIDFERLRQINAESVAWIWVPGTRIDYPLMHGEDNEKYLRRAYDGSISSGGSIFLDYRNDGGLTDRHSVVYGHNMKDDSMFGQLSKYADQDFCDSHPYIYLLTDTYIRKYRIFSVYITTADHDSYRLYFEGDEDYGNYLKRLAAYSWYETAEAPEKGDRIITLSTCVNDKSRRRVIHAVLIEETPVTDDRGTS
jgi:sortase B